MPHREIAFVPGNYYHVFNRGVNKGSIFFDQENYIFFLKRMREYLFPAIAEVIAYCLMPNHFHLIVCPLVDGFSDKMGLFLMSYAKAINSRYDRVGPLFQGRFRAKQIGNNEYLLHLSRYLHINPVLAAMVAKAEEWEYSSYRDFIGLRKYHSLRREIVLEQFSMTNGDLKNQQKAYREFVEEYVEKDLSKISHLL